VAWYLVLLVPTWIVLRPPRVTNWTWTGTPGDALTRGLFLAPVGGPIAWALVGGVVVGLVATVRRRGPWWVVGLYAMGLFFHVATQLHDSPDLRWWLAGVWYSDPFRTAALLPLTTIPLVAVGVGYAQDTLVEGIRTLRPEQPRAARVAVSAAFVALGILAAQTPAVADTVDHARATNTYSPSSRLLTSHEHDLLTRLPALVPRHAMIAGNPETGAALGYAFADREAVEPFSGRTQGGPLGAIVMQRLDRMRTDPQVCPAVRRLNVQFVLDFGSDPSDQGHAGLDELTPANGFTLAAQDGPAKLYRVTGCGRPGRTRSERPAALPR
jgi:hypothetical protein